MLGPINHIAIAVPDLTAAMSLYEKLGADISPAQDLPEHGVTVVFVKLPNTKIELLHPLGDGSPIASFLAKNPSGGIHHLCFEVTDIFGARQKLNESGIRILASGEPKIGAHGSPVLFAHPKDFCGTLVEFEQVTRS
ncbi:methylmalonyl-CoA epimerase [Rhizobium leguminosarum]|uniref:methylmalonyl-CoA epimerase n=1 Tax=Rhizobium leguminosarum TaxID=384 RepID=UPI003F967500